MCGTALPAKSIPSKVNGISQYRQEKRQILLHILGAVNRATHHLPTPHRRLHQPPQGAARYSLLFSPVTARVNPEVIMNMSLSPTATVSGKKISIKIVANIVIYANSF